MSALNQNPVHPMNKPLLAAEEDERSAYLEEVRYYSTQFGSGHWDGDEHGDEADHFSAAED